MDEKSKITIIGVGKDGGMESYQLMLPGESPKWGCISAAYRGKAEYASFLEKIGEDFARMIFERDSQLKIIIKNGSRIDKSARGWRIDQLEEIDYHLFEEILKRKLTEVARQPAKPLTIGRRLN
ncbi:MAG: hypothetical protein AABW47_04935 [Nanoarchaeota archaeon]